MITDAAAEVGDPTLRTDHPVYAGEGAFQEIEDCVRFATRGVDGTQNKAIALYRWLLQHQYHLNSPHEWCVADHQPNAATWNDLLIPYDADAARFSFGFGLCGTTHAWNEPYWRALGFESRRRAFPDHVNSEIFYDGAWHAFDTDMAGLVFRDDGVVAGYDDIARNPSLVRHARPPLPCYPYIWPSDYKTMKKGWVEVADKGADHWYKLYYTGYAAQPGVVHLRRGETFTRWFDRDHFGGIERRRFWHADAERKGGPFRDWTYVNTGHTDHPVELNRKSVLGNASYCNAEFVYTPLLDTDAYREGVFAQTPNVVRSSAPKLMSGDGRRASVVFAHFSPYIIAGDPVDDINPMAGKATDGMLVSGRAVGAVSVEVSVDDGLTWIDAGDVRDEFRLDLTEQTKGRYAWRIRLSFAGTSGLDAVTFTTTGQVNQSMYPRLTPGGSTVTYRAGNRAVTQVRPNYGLSEDRLSAVEVKSLRSDNIDFVGHRELTDVAYRVTDNRPGHIVLRVESPRPLREVRAAAKFALRVPTPEKNAFRLDLSTDGGKTWKPMATPTIPADNELSSTWIGGRAEVSEPDVTSVLVRIQAHQGGHRTGIYDARAYGIYRTGQPQDVIVTYGWKEGDQSKTHRESIPRGIQTHKFAVPTGDRITDEFVRISAE